MKILIELYSNDIKIGAVNDVLDLARYSKGFGIKYYLAGPLNDELSNAAKSCGMELVPLCSRQISRRHFVSYLLNVIKWIFIIKNISPDVVHLNYVSWGPSLGLAAYLSGVPVVARAGGRYDSNNLTHKWVSRYLANCAQQGAELMNSVLADKVAVVGDLVNLERFKSVEKPVAPYPPKAEGFVRFLFLGQLVERKGINFLVEAFSKVSKNCDLLLVGGDWNSPGFPQKIRQMIKDCDLTDRIHCLNHREDAIALMSDCDVFVLPSLSEARPRSIIEAMLMGKCVLATGVGGVPTLIRHGETGLLVKAKDSDVLSEYMEKLVVDGELRHDLSVNAQKHAAITFDPVKTAENYFNIYVDVINARNKKRFPPK